MKPCADVKKCAAIVADLDRHVDAVCPTTERSEDNEILAGVGFGPTFYEKVSQVSQVSQSLLFASRPVSQNGIRSIHSIVH